MIEKMEQYNILITSYKLAELFFNDSAVEDSKKIEMQSKLSDLCRKLSALVTWFEGNKIKVEQHELEHGFNVIFRVKRFEKYKY